jgi:hypothetical protein
MPVFDGIHYAETGKVVFVTINYRLGVLGWAAHPALRDPETGACANWAIGSALLAMTPLSPFRPRRWRGALLPRQVQIRFEILEPEKRPVSATADNLEVRDVTRVEIAEDRSREMTMLFDAGHSLDERVLAEQFLY